MGNYQVGLERALRAVARMRASKPSLRRLPVLALVVLAPLLVSIAPAEALNAHSLTGVFGKSFEEGAGGSLSSPNAVAVDEATGDIYVLDKGNNRVVRFGPSHEFVEAWGFGVKAGKSKYEQCQAGEKCGVGIAGFDRGQFDEPEGIAIDNDSSSPSFGDVYVVANSTRSKAAVDKFTSSGALVDQLPLIDANAVGPVDGVAVDPSGTVWVEREDAEDSFEILRFSDAPQSKALGHRSELTVPDEDEVIPSNPEAVHESAQTFDEARPVRPGFAIDSNDDLYITYSPGAYDAEELEEEESQSGQAVESLAQPCQVHACYVAKIPVAVVGKGSAQTVEEVLPPEGSEIITFQAAEVDGESAGGVAVDPASGGELGQDVFVDNIHSVGVFTSEDAPIERFGSEQLRSAGGGGGLAVNGDTSEALLANEQTGQIEQYSFAARKSGPPTVETDSVFPAHVGAMEAEARAMIEPDGAATHYRVQYGEVECAGHEASCKEAVASPAEEKEGFGVALQGFGPQEARIKLAGLSPSTTYHFRFIVENELAQGTGAVISEEHTFTTQPSPVEARLLDGRAWELVTPSEKHGATIYAIRKEGGQIQAAANGESIAYVASSPVGKNQPAGYRGPEPVEAIATREHNESNEPWSSEDIATGNEPPSDGFEAGGPWEYQAFSSELADGLASPHTDNPLNGGSAATHEEEAPEGRDLYVRDSTAPECELEQESQAPCFVPLVVSGDDTSHEALSLEAAKLEFQAATTSFKHVVFGSSVPLTENAQAGHQGLYLWTAGTKGKAGRLQLISVEPATGLQDTNGEAFVGARASSVGAGGQRMAMTAVSEESTPHGETIVRVFWNSGETHLFMTEVIQTDKGEKGKQAELETSVKSTSLTEPNTGVTPEVTAKPLFQTATANGSTAFFEDQERLTEDANTKASGELTGELYAFEAGNAEGKRVTDLTPDIIKRESANIIGGPLGAGEIEKREANEKTEATVYFVANGVLSTEPGPAGERATPGGCFVLAPSGHTCNLYAAHRNAEGHWERPRFIVQLSAEDAPDWGEPISEIKAYFQRVQTSRVSPNGEYVAFMTDRHLLGYNNRDANSGIADEEVYVYHYADNSLVCASCNPSGARPVGVEDEQNGGEGEGLVVDRPEAWAHERVDHWLAGNIPTWTTYGAFPASYQSRYLSNNGRLFFDSADALVPVQKPTRLETVTVDGATKQLPVGVENVYEYEPVGAGSCASGSANTAKGASGEGCVQLISSGESEHESAFVDASEKGTDAFFVTAAKLTPLDIDDAYDIYDARECTGPEGERCAPPPGAGERECTGEECRPTLKDEEPAPPLSPSTTGASSGSHNLSSASANLRPTGSVLGTTAHKKATPTRAQLLAKALAACKKDKKKSKRLACERTAHKKYGAKKKPAHKAHKSAGKSGNVAPSRLQRGAETR